MIAVLREQCLKQPDAMEPEVGQHAPRAQVAELLHLSGDHAVRIEGQVGPHDTLLVPKNEAMVWRINLPGHRHSTAPGRHRNPGIEVGVQEFRHHGHVRVGDRSEFDGHLQFFRPGWIGAGATGVTRASTCMDPGYGNL